MTAQRGRPKGLGKIAEGMLTGSCIGSATFERSTKDSTEIIDVVHGGMGTKIIAQEKIAHDATPVERIARAMGTPKESQNGMPFMGYYDIGGELVEYYGTPEGYKRLISQ